MHLDAVCCVVGFTNPPACVAPRCTSNPHPSSLSQRAPSDTLFYCDATKSTYKRLFWSKVYARFVEPSFSWASLSRLIIIIVRGGQTRPMLHPCEKIYFRPRDIFYAHYSLLLLPSSSRPREHATSAFSRRLILSRRFSRGPADIHGTKSVVCGIKRHLDEWKTISRVCSYAPINK